jgi:environmental stress-induced protein Ves
MERWTHIGPGGARSVPWRNGRGMTVEIAVGPAGTSFEAGDFDWRVSRAGVVDSGPFSCFPGYERVLVVVAGEGLRLDHGADGGSAWLRPFEPHRFSGDWSTWAEPTAGPIDDVGVIARRDRVHVEVEVLRLGSRRARVELAASEEGLLHVFGGRLEVRVAGEEEPVGLDPRESLQFHAGVGHEVELVGRTADAGALLVRLRSL